MNKVLRRVTRQGVRISGKTFWAPALIDLEGECLELEVPEGPLPETLRATCASRPLFLQLRNE
jgi:hypothetical protein